MLDALSQKDLQGCTWQVLGSEGSPADGGTSHRNRKVILWPRIMAFYHGPRPARAWRSGEESPHIATLLFFPGHSRELRVHLLPSWSITHIKNNTRAKHYQAFVAATGGERCQGLTYANPGKCSTCEQYPSTRDFFS